MKDLALVRRYSQGFAGALADEAEYAAARSGLEAFRDLYETHPQLRGIVESPFFTPRKKAEILNAVLDSAALPVKARRLVALLFEHGRLAYLDAIVRALPGAWLERLGIPTFEVASAVALADAQKARLRERLEAAEGRPVNLEFRLEPALIGGLELRRGHIVYDASVRGGLARLRDRIQEG